VSGAPAAPPRVALIASSYHPYFGGVEEHVRQVARCYAQAGVPVEVWTVDRGEKLGEQMVDGIRVRYLPTPLPARRAGALARYTLRAPGARRAWRRAHAQFGPDILHVHCFGPNGVYGLRLHRATRTPLVVSSHGETLADDNGIYRRSRLLRGALAEALAAAARVSAPSEFVLDDLRANYALTGGEVVPNGVDLTVHPNPDAVPERERPYLLGVGRLGRMKGFDLLIEAFARSGLGDALRLVIAGDGPEREALQRQAEALGLGDRVRLAGRLDPQHVADSMAAARAVVVPSRAEAFGIVALEAWRSRTALVMTSLGGAPGFVRDGVDGLLVDPTDTEALARCLRAVALDDARREALASAGAERAGQFGWPRVADAYLALYAEVAA